MPFDLLDLSDWSNYSESAITSVDLSIHNNCQIRAAHLFSPKVIHQIISFTDEFIGSSNMGLSSITFKQAVKIGASAIKGFRFTILNEKSNLQSGG